MRDSLGTKVNKVDSSYTGRTEQGRAALSYPMVPLSIEYMCHRGKDKCMLSSPFHCC